MHSQNNEEKAILEFFDGASGSFLDIGAFDGVAISNTLALAERGWRGVLIEPAPEPFARMARHYKQFPLCECVQAAVTADGRWCKFYYEAHRQWAGTVMDECLKAHQVQVDYSFMVRTISPDEIRKQWPFPFDFISVDAEWADFEIVSAADALLKDCKLLCIEKGGGHDWLALLKEKGFTNIVLSTPENYLVSR